MCTHRFAHYKIAIYDGTHNINTQHFQNRMFIYYTALLDLFLFSPHILCRADLSWSVLVHTHTHTLLASPSVHHSNARCLYVLVSISPPCRYRFRFNFLAPNILFHLFGPVLKCTCISVVRHPKCGRVCRSVCQLSKYTCIKCIQ